MTALRVRGIDVDDSIRPRRRPQPIHRRDRRDRGGRSRVDYILSAASAISAVNRLEATHSPRQRPEPQHVRRVARDRLLAVRRDGHAQYTAGVAVVANQLLAGVDLPDADAAVRPPAGRDQALVVRREGYAVAPLRR